MKLLLKTIAAVVLVGCGESQPPEPPTVKAPDISIHDAAGAWKIEAVKRHLAAGTDVNSKDEDGELTPLHWAVDLVAPNKARTDLNRKERKELVELLIANDADVNALDKDSRTPLDLAQRNYSFNSTRQYPAPKSKAAILEIVELLVKNGAKHGTIQGAITGGDIKAVKEFLTNGADVNARDTVGQPLLVHAPTKEMAEMLIMNGANINAKAKHGKVENGPTVLSLAAIGVRTEVVELLIAKGADVNAKSESGRTPLIGAALHNRKKIVELLITKGADVNAKTYSEDTPLHMAADDGHKEVVKLLIANGADINAKTNNGLTPLDKATKRGPHYALKEVNGVMTFTQAHYSETVKLLRKHGGKTRRELKAEGK